MVKSVKLGPGDEQVDLVFVRAAKGAGLHLVHPTWAGTFVLAAMVFLFPNAHLVLLDSDCVPVTLFEIEELWALTTQALTLNRMSEQQGEADGPAHKARKTRQDDEEDNPGQRVILVTEPHTDINAGLVIILGSDHDSPLDSSILLTLRRRQVSSLLQARMTTGTALLRRCLENIELSRWTTSAITMILSTALLRNKARFYKVD